jgi:hypothetical protein
MRRYLLDTGIMGDFINHRRGVDIHAIDGPYFVRSKWL